MTSWTAVVLGGEDPLLAGLAVDGRPLSDRALDSARELGTSSAGSLAEAVGRGGGVLVLDAHCPMVSADDVTRVWRAAEDGPAVGVRPVTDTVKRVRRTTDAEWLGETVDRETLVAVAAPLAVPDVALLAGLDQLGNLPELVVALRRRAEVALVELGATARRVGDASDLEVLSAR